MINNEWINRQSSLGYKGGTRYILLKVSWLTRYCPCIWLQYRNLSNGSSLWEPDTARYRHESSVSCFRTGSLPGRVQFAQCLHNNRTMLTGSQDKKCGSSEALLRGLSFLIYTHHIKSSHTMTTCKLPSLYNPSTS